MVVALLGLAIVEVLVHALRRRGGVKHGEAGVRESESDPSSVGSPRAEPADAALAHAEDARQASDSEPDEATVSG